MLCTQTLLFFAGLTFGLLPSRALVLVLAAIGATHTKNYFKAIGKLAKRIKT
jgi:hypothetical protein